MGRLGAVGPTFNPPVPNPLTPRRFRRSLRVAAIYGQMPSNLPAVGHQQMHEQGVRIDGQADDILWGHQASLYSFLTGGSAMYSLSHRSLWPSFAGDISACASRALKTSLYSVLFGTVFLAFRLPHQTTGRSSFRFGLWRGKVAGHRSPNR